MKEVKKEENMVAEEVISSSNTQIEKIKKEEEEEEEEDPGFAWFTRLFKKKKELEEEEGEKLGFFELINKCVISKKYIICTPPKNDDDKQLHMIGLIEGMTYLEPFEHLSLNHGFIFYNDLTKGQFYKHSNNVDGTPTFAGYVFGEMKKFMAFLTAGGTQEDLGKWLDAEVAKNPLNF